MIGDYRVEIIPDAEFRLDGGAMFGVIPRVLWEKVCPPDEFNRISLNMNCLFIETPTEKILIETGIGEKWTRKQAEIYGIFRTKTFAESLLEKTGWQPKDISIVINTHLHFDHAGGNTISDNNGKAVPQFPNARYCVSKAEYDHAENPSLRDRASYLPENWRPLLESHQLHLMPNSYEAISGLRLEQMRGHNETMQTVSLRRGGKTFYSFADLIPTRFHLSPTWIMGYDLFPMDTLKAKNELLPRAVAEDWLCFFYHDFENPLHRLTQKEGKFLIQEDSLFQ